MKKMKKILVGFFMLCAVLAAVIMPKDARAASSDFTIENGVLTKYTGSGGDVVIPDGVTSIGEAAFYNCKSLFAITIPNSVTNIGNEAFAMCINLSNITIPNSVTSIGNGAFYRCESLSGITLANSVTSIGKSAFSYCKSLSRVEIPSSVINIGDDVFTVCNSLLEINVDSSNQSYSSADGILFDKRKIVLKCCPTGKTGNVAIPDSVTSIGENAFWGCTNLSNVTIPDSVTDIGMGAFGGCVGLTNITIPKSVTYIDDWAFAGCENLREMSFLNPKTKLGHSQKYAATITYEYDILDFGDGPTDFKNPIVTIKGYANSTAQGLVNYKNQWGGTQFKFVALDGTGSNDTPTDAQQIYSLLKKAKATKSLSVKKGKSQTVKVTLPDGLKKVSKFSSNNKKGQVKISFKSSNKKIATVSTKGKVTGKKKGTAKITVTLSAHDGKGVSVRSLIVTVTVTG